jgi:hypothetical protein
LEGEDYNMQGGGGGGGRGVAGRGAKGEIVGRGGRSGKKSFDDDGDIDDADAILDEFD